jgi:hypothetical protein
VERPLAGFLVAVDPASAGAFEATAAGAAVAFHPLDLRRGSDELPDSHNGTSGLAGGITAGSVVGIGIGALAAMLVPGAGAVMLGGILASMAGFGTAGAAVGGLLGTMSGDEIVEETAQFVRESADAGRVVYVVEADLTEINSAKDACRAAGAGIHGLNAAETGELHKQALDVS